jgi:hypothetical protein
VFIYFTDYIKPICLPFEINVTGEEEKKYEIAGWGKTDFCKLFNDYQLQLKYEIIIYHANRNALLSCVFLLDRQNYSP